jgi:hypothetical protein
MKGTPMNARIFKIGTLLSVALTAVFAAPALALAEHGTHTLRNDTGVDIVYQAGIADDQGFVAWQTYKLAPGESHVWSWQGRPLALLWDLTLGDDKFVGTRNGLTMRPEGFMSAFFLYGNQVWIGIAK